MSAEGDDIKGMRNKVFAWRRAGHHIPKKELAVSLQKPGDVRWARQIASRPGLFFPL